MSKCIVLNEASLPFTTAAECEKNLEIFFSILHMADSEDVSFCRVDEIEGNWNSLIYAHGFELGKWINSLVNKDQQRIVASVLTNVRCPLLAEENQGSANDMLFTLRANRDIEVRGLGVASAIGGHGISFASHPNWLSNPIEIVREWDEGDQLLSEDIVVSNIFEPFHIEQIAAESRRKKQANRNYLSTLTQDNNADFSNIIFCDSALEDLRSLSVTVDDYPRIITALTQLNESIKVSNNLAELITNSRLEISGESPETMAAPKHARKRIFTHPSLGKITFEIHVKNFPDAKRMHILPDYNNRTVCIGYFGRHLSTVSFPK